MRVEKSWLLKFSNLVAKVDFRHTAGDEVDSDIALCVRLREVVVILVDILHFAHLAENGLNRFDFAAHSAIFKVFLRHFIEMLCFLVR